MPGCVTDLLLLEVLPAIQASPQKQGMRREKEVS